MPIRPLLDAESGVFGPGELRDITATFDALLTELALRDRNDVATLMLAKLTIELAKKGQFNAGSLRARVLKEMRPLGKVN